jgi:DNA-directed RNA polymerase subunit RPC12/RpoP
MGSLRIYGGAAGLLLGISIAVWLGIVIGATWPAIVFWAFVLGTFGARIGSFTPLSIWQHQFLIQIGSVMGAIGGVFLGIYLVHGFPPRGDFGWPVFACSAALGGLGFVLPLLVMSRLVPVRCPQCGGRSDFGTDSTFFHKMLAKYHYRCRSCGHAEEANFNRTVQ